MIIDDERAGLPSRSDGWLLRAVTSMFEYDAGMRAACAGYVIGGCGMAAAEE